jgi:hypothetical protein
LFFMVPDFFFWTVFRYSGYQTFPDECAIQNSCAHSVEYLSWSGSLLISENWNGISQLISQPLQAKGVCLWQKLKSSSNGQQKSFGFEKDAESCNRRARPLHISFSPWSTNRIKSANFCCALRYPRQEIDVDHLWFSNEYSSG